MSAKNYVKTSDPTSTYKKTRQSQLKQQSCLRHLTDLTKIYVRFSGNFLPNLANFYIKAERTLVFHIPPDDCHMQLLTGDSILGGIFKCFYSGSYFYKLTIKTAKLAISH